MSATDLPNQVFTLEQAKLQINRYESVLASSLSLQARISFTHAWYAIKINSGWTFAPSKFLRREFTSEKDYLRRAGHKITKPDGNRTENMLAEWFDVVQPDTSLGRELSDALNVFIRAYKKERRKGDRISIMKDQVQPLHSRRERNLKLDARITMDPAICGGRPTIRGTRMRVTDILEMLASGADEKQILADFDYLTHEDIAATLSYAAVQIDHRVVRAA